MDVTNFYIQEVRFSLSKIEKHISIYIIKGSFSRAFILIVYSTFIILLQKLL